MDRKEFLKICSYSCLSLVGIPALQNCTGVKQLEKINIGRTVEVEEKDFLKDENNPNKYRRMITIKTEGLNYPILLYRISENDYRAFLLQCPHQSAELSVQGDIISCPAHGSEFNNQGEVVQGPAESNLVRFKVNKEGPKIQIILT